MAAPALTHTSVPDGRWTIDDEYTHVGFAVAYAGVATVRGRFCSFRGAVDVAGGRLAGGWGRVRAGSVDTGIRVRDDHLRSAEFLDAGNHPELILIARRIATEGDRLTVDAALTIRGVTSSAVLRGAIGGVSTDPYGAVRLGLRLSGTVSRATFGMRFNQPAPGGRLLVSDEVDLLLDVSAVLRG